ncbi:MAG: extracellular solute-binding protein, partial [Spirochaetaceae bacterium]|nr:extracellular solute-binding protein [Spirochaetaceae bacterium]
IKSGFEAENPNIKIEWVTAPYGEIMNQVINMAGGGDKVDCIFSELGSVPGFEDAGLSASIKDNLPQSFIDDFYPDIINAFKINGEAYGIPLYITPYVLYYNKSLFQAAGLDPSTPPTTYDEMLADAAKLSKLKDSNGNPVYAFGQTTASVPISGSSLQSMVFNFGGQVLDANGKLSVDNKGFKDAFAMIKTLNERGYMPQNAKLKDLRNLFALGQLGMYYDQSWGFNGISSINPDAKSFTASAAPLKGGDGNGKSSLESHCFVLVDNGKARAYATSKFVQYVISEKGLGYYLSNLTSAYPARKSMSNMKGVLDNPVLKGAANSVSNVTAPTAIAQLNDVNLELCSLAQAVSVGNEDVDTAIANFKKVMNAKLGN